MSNKNLAGKALQIIYLYWKNHDRSYPTSGEVANALGVTSQHWGNLRKSMIEKELLKPSKVWGMEFTEGALATLQKNYNIGKKLGQYNNNENDKTTDVSIKDIIGEVRSNLQSTFNFVEVGLLGGVKAGYGNREDDLEFYSGDETVSVPDKIGDPEKFYALLVKGESMIHENIFPGDYVVVKKVSLLDIGDGDLIVAKYLPNDYINKSVPKIEQAVEARRNSWTNTKIFYTSKKGG